MLVDNLIFAELPPTPKGEKELTHINSFLAKSCLILAERLGFSAILNFILYFLMMRAERIPSITPGAVQVRMNTKLGVFSGINLGTIFTQKAVIAAVYAPIILPA